MILIGDALQRLRELGDGCVDCIVTSPPYWGVKDYDIKVAERLGRKFIGIDLKEWT